MVGSVVGSVVCSTDVSMGIAIFPSSQSTPEKPKRTILSNDQNIHNNVTPYYSINSYFKYDYLTVIPQHVVIDLIWMLQVLCYWCLSVSLS